MSELIFICPEVGYELYDSLSKYFNVEIVDSNDGTMGVIDALRVLVEPISKTVETIGYIIIALINKNSCTINIKNGSREIAINGKMKCFSNEEIINLVSKVFEE